ncbi:hypothetical protein K438DRAFT_1771885 [Mycena galopus ATCC 62051]|nr:hypothetical protein K438DRAFT_1771885 [Mycena galopus ATCC 62051]
MTQKIQSIHGAGLHSEKLLKWQTASSVAKPHAFGASMPPRLAAIGGTEPDSRESCSGVADLWTLSLAVSFNIALSLVHADPHSRVRGLRDDLLSGVVRAPLTGNGVSKYSDACFGAPVVSEKSGYVYNANGEADLHPLPCTPSSLPPFLPSSLPPFLLRPFLLFSAAHSASPPADRQIDDPSTSGPSRRRSRARRQQTEPVARPPSMCVGVSVAQHRSRLALACARLASSTPGAGCGRNGASRRPPSVEEAVQAAEKVALALALSADDTSTHRIRKRHGVSCRISSVREERQVLQRGGGKQCHRLACRRHKHAQGTGQLPLRALTLSSTRSPRVPSTPARTDRTTSPSPSSPPRVLTRPAHEGDGGVGIAAGDGWDRTGRGHGPRPEVVCVLGWAVGAAIRKGSGTGVVEVVSVGDVEVVGKTWSMQRAPTRVVRHMCMCMGVVRGGTGSSSGVEAERMVRQGETASDVPPSAASVRARGGGVGGACASGVPHRLERTRRCRSASVQSYAASEGSMENACEAFALVAGVLTRTRAWWMWIARWLAHALGVGAVVRRDTQRASYHTAWSPRDAVCAVLRSESEMRSGYYAFGLWVEFLMRAWMWVDVDNAAASTPSVSLLARRVQLALGVATRSRVDRDPSLLQKKTQSETSAVSGSQPPGAALGERNVGWGLEYAAARNTTAGWASAQWAAGIYTTASDRRALDLSERGSLAGREQRERGKALGMDGRAHRMVKRCNFRPSSRSTWSRSWRVCYKSPYPTGGETSIGNAGGMDCHPSLFASSLNWRDVSTFPPSVPSGHWNQAGIEHYRMPLSPCYLSLVPRQFMDNELQFAAELNTDTAFDEDTPSDRYKGAFFPKAKHFVIAGGKFKSVTHNFYQVAPSDERDFRVISLGDLNLLHANGLGDGFGIVHRPPQVAQRRQLDPAASDSLLPPSENFIFKIHVELDLLTLLRCYVVTFSQHPINIPRRLLQRYVNLFLRKPAPEIIINLDRTLVTNGGVQSLVE